MSFLMLWCLLDFCLIEEVLLFYTGVMWMILLSWATYLSYFMCY